MAYKKGNLTNNKVNVVQNWALSYYLFKENEKNNAKQEDFWKMFTMLINPDLYKRVYEKEIEQAAIESGDDGSGDVGYSTDNLDEIESFMQQLRDERKLIPDNENRMIGNGDWQ